MLIKVPRVPKCHLSTRDHKVPKCLSVQVPRVHECTSDQVPFDSLSASSVRVPKYPSALSVPESLKCSRAQVP